LLNSIMNTIKQNINYQNMMQINQNIRKNMSETELCKKIIVNLHEEFTKRYVYEIQGWCNPNDKFLKTKNEIAVKSSPLKELFTGTIKIKQGNEKIIDCFDIIEVVDDVQKTLDSFLTKYNENSEPLITRFPMILIFAGELINGSEEIKFKNQSYILKSVIDQNTLYQQKGKDCKFMIYRIKEIDTF
ncbi:hypothetical protein BDAP_002765, partial [Binucleata daphniae]